jgi:hypothetical protein
MVKVYTCMVCESRVAADGFHKKEAKLFSLGSFLCSKQCSDFFDREKANRRVWGKILPKETPEHQTCGLAKNLAR